MIDIEKTRSIDIAIEGAITRIRDRATALGPGPSALGDALARAVQGGKRFRPALVMAAYDAFRYDDANASAVLSVAAAFELLHTAFIVHDDVIDGDTVRRGRPNVAGEFRSRGRRHHPRPVALTRRFRAVPQGAGG